MTVGEFEFIAKRLRPLAASSLGALDLADDAAVIDPVPGRQLVLTKDAMVEGVHFLPDDPAAQIAQKLLRVNLSDLAAMGAAPLGYLMVIARPGILDDPWLASFCAGLGEDQEEFGIGLLGGDTVSTPGPLTLSITALGWVPSGTALRRRDARPGDDIHVSGTLGDGALGLRVRLGKLDPGAAATVFLVDRYRRPQPRLDLGQALRGIAAAAIDVSDGLLADLDHILEASGVGAEVLADSLPLSVAAQGVEGARAAALTGGDDYELLFTAPRHRRDAIGALAARLKVPITRIGRIDIQPGLRVLDCQGEPVTSDQRGWRHF